jgi:alpha-1,2-mannosyltransferase
MQRFSSWVFWSLWAVIVLIAASFYYEKASDQRSAFVRWQPQVLQFWAGVNIYDKMLFPNPPIMPITLYPLAALPTVTGAMCWFAIKILLTTAALAMLFKIVQPPGRAMPVMFRSLVLLLSLRPILGDLHHGNNNLLILFLVVALFYAWRKGYDVGAGLLLGLAAAYKVTPALFFVYFAYKRSWRTVGWGILGLGIFLLLVPSIVVGPQFNGECLGLWFHRMVTPFVVKGATSPQLQNQSLIGVISRLLSDWTTGLGRYQVSLDLNLASWPPKLVGQLTRGMAVALIGLLAYLCRTKTTDRRDPRLLGEVALVVLTMLFVSERSWKHHYVTVLLPYTYLVSEFFSQRVGPRGRAVLAASWATSFCLMAATSTEIGGLFAEGQGHEIAQGYGSFLWAGVVLYAAVAWRVWARRLEGDSSAAPTRQEGGTGIPRSHLASAVRAPAVAS